MYYTFLEELWGENLKILPAPLWQDAIDFLMEQYNVFACPIFDHIQGKGYWYTVGIAGKSCNSVWNIETLYEARKLAILEAIEIIKTKLKNDS